MKNCCIILPVTVNFWIIKYRGFMPQEYFNVVKYSILLNLVAFFSDSHTMTVIRHLLTWKFKSVPSFEMQRFWLRCVPVCVSFILEMLKAWSLYKKNFSESISVSVIGTFHVQIDAIEIVSITGVVINIGQSNNPDNSREFTVPCRVEFVTVECVSPEHSGL
jgi:hypothetical protein